MRGYDAVLVVDGAIFADIVDSSIFGHIYKDNKRRFTDGSSVRTSQVKDLIISPEGTFAVTNNSTYKVVVI